MKQDRERQGLSMDVVSEKSSLGLIHKGMILEQNLHQFLSPIEASAFCTPVLVNGCRGGLGR